MIFFILPIWCHNALYSLSNPSVIFLEVVRVGIGRCDVSEEAYGLSLSKSGTGLDRVRMQLNERWEDRALLLTGTWVQYFFFSNFITDKMCIYNVYEPVWQASLWNKRLYELCPIFLIQCIYYMNPFDMLRCEINAFTNYAPFS
jgi:hypothetical protein